MTCIVALADRKNKIVTMGADSAATTDTGSIVTLTRPKIFINNGYLFGCAGSVRMSQLLEFGWLPPKPKKGAELAGFMAIRFTDHLRHLFKLGGFATKDSDAEYGGRFLIAKQGRIFEVQSDYNVSEVACEYVSIGSGQELANGAMFATSATGWSPETRIEVALKAASEFCNTVRGPYNFLTHKG